jgi:hypothetical protein
MLRDERQTSNIDIVTATGNDMVNHQLMFTCITCKAQRHTPGHFARIDNSYSEMEGWPLRLRRALRQPRPRRSYLTIRALSRRRKCGYINDAADSANNFDVTSDN